MGKTREVAVAAFLGPQAAVELEDQWKGTLDMLHFFVFGYQRGSWLGVPMAFRGTETGKMSPNP